MIYLRSEELGSQRAVPSAYPPSDVHSVTQVKDRHSYMSHPLLPLRVHSSNKFEGGSRHSKGDESVWSVILTTMPECLPYYVGFYHLKEYHIIIYYARMIMFVVFWNFLISHLSLTFILENISILCGIFSLVSCFVCRNDLQSKAQ